ncbi:hypothetical protein TVAG_172130 [Trichomonas vaginalis G3]|uniref:Uncharacterized protein n=1 Tax=Trichomonas vaginalis (strain ATCC PRA-98 / G3) TaxID=412133 RepID=A2DEW4_TRIV3|nr:biological adhesion protein [Trichomonas vaginalis G3]EAY20956.1 hypothetical protein TVAG_172130 [Trichomonas vaginalis G3]KAI5519115.1 biological adhesion protein [Trichomonas vaginalis G3]|eukprot:XP_001581942.1 hypothetical protein [Trichomonas vaginalis G3]
MIGKNNELQGKHQGNKQKTSDDIISYSTGSVPREKYIDLLSHLDDAISFIRGFCFTGGETIGSDVRSLILSHCIKLSNFLEENMLEIGIENIPREYSIFDARALDTPEKQMNEFLKFASNEDLDMHPIKELFTIFCGIVNVNNMLLNYNKKLESQIENFKKNTVPISRLKTLNDEYFEVVQQNASNQVKIEKLEAAIKEITGKPEIFYESIIDDAKTKTELNETAFNALKKQNEDLIKTLEEYKQTTTQSIESLTDTLNTCKASLDEEVQQHSQDVDKLTKEKESLQDKIKFLGSELQVAKTALLDLSKKLKEKFAKYKEAIKAQKDTCSMLDAIQNRTNTLIKENECLADKCLNYQAENKAFKEQVDQLIVLETRLRNSREKFKERLHKSQKELEEMTKQKSETEEALNSRVKTVIDNAKEESRDLVSENSNLKAEIENLKKSLEASKQEASEAKVAEKTANMKIAKIQKNAEDEKQALQAKSDSLIQSIKSQAEKQVSDSAKQVEDTRKLLLKLCEMSPSSTENVENLCNALESKHTFYTIQKKILLDATKIRDKYDIKYPESIEDYVDNLKKTIEKEEKEAEELKKSNESSNSQIEFLKEELEKRQGSDVIINEWRNWSNKMQAEISGQPLTDGSDRAARTVLSEAIKAGRGNYTVVSKISLLRDEKIIMNKFEKNELSNSNKNGLSVKAVNTALRFMKRLQTTSGHCPPSDFLHFV